MKKVAILILGYRALPFLKSKLIESIHLAASRIEDAEVNIVYLDNYSRDGSVEYLLRNHPDIDVLSATYNYMYCKGTNVGIKYCHDRYHPDYFILVDGDNLCEPDAYNELVKFANAHASVGLVQPLVKSFVQKDVLYSCGHVYADDVFCRPLKNIPSDESALHNLPSCSISSTLIKSEVFSRCGLIDEIFVMYYESSDLSFRARQEGFSCACATKAITFNEGTVASEFDDFHRVYYRHRNGLIFWKKHDEIKFKKIKDIQVCRLNVLNEILDKKRYADNMLEESERKGIEDGLRIAESTDFATRNYESMEVFEKTDAILCQTSRRTALSESIL